MMERQIHAYDCGHCCLAYILGIPAETVRSFMPAAELDNLQLERALRIHRRFVGYLEIANGSRELRGSDLAICNVTDEGHWVVYEHGNFLCPAGQEWRTEDVVDFSIIVKPKEKP